MYDLNFFDYFTKERNIKIKSKMLKILLIIVLFFIMIGIPITNKIVLCNLENKFSEIERKNSSLTNKNINKIEEQQEKISIMNDYINNANKIKNKISKCNMIDDFLLENIYYNKPEELYIDNILIIENKVEIKGFTSNKKYINYYLNNKNFRNVQIDYIKRNSSTADYSYSLKLNF